MKFRNLFIASAAATISYLLVSKKDQIRSDVTETKAIVDDLKSNYQSIQEQLALIKSYKEPLTDLANDLQHKAEAFQKETQVRLKEIQKIQEKYTAEEAKKTN